MRRVFLIISLLCLMPFAMMAQMRDAYNPVVTEETSLIEGYTYGFQIAESSGSFVNFDIEQSSMALNELKSYQGLKVTAAEMIPFNSTKDFVYAYTTVDGIDGTFCTVDPTTGELTVIASGVQPMSDMAYDPTTKTMYGLAYGVLYTIDLNNGTATEINAMQTGSNNWVALAINNEGLMYAITNTFSNTSAELYRINPNTWNSTLVGSVGYKTQYTQSMAFDRDNNELYWWQNSAAGSNFLKVNPADATCTVIWPNNGVQMAGLMFRNQPEKFDITYETVENGAFSGPVQAAANDVVTITVTPEYGYRLGTLTWNGNAIDVEAGAPYTFTMPEEAVTVTGSFLLSLHNITVLDPLNGTLATEPAGQGLYPETITVIPTMDPGFGMGTITWSANGVDNTITAEPYEFPMPDYDVTVSAEYVQTGVNTLSIADDYVGYFNETVTVAVDLANENLVAGAQMDIALGENLNFTEGTLALSERAEGEGWVITGQIKTGNILRVTVFNTGLATFAGNEGTIFTFDVTCNPVISMNPLTFSNVIVGTPDATQLEMVTVNGNVEIKDVVMNQPENVFACFGTTIETIEFTLDESNEEGEASFAWVNDNAGIGLAESGNGNIAGFTAANETTGAITANITVTPSLTVEGVTHVGTPKTFTITVFPEVVMDPIEDIVTCSTGETMEVAFTSPVTDGTMDYAWQCSNPAFGIAAEGNGNVSFTATNEGNEAVSTTITVTPVYTNGENTCMGAATSFDVTVYPTVVMNPVESIVTCSTGETMNVEFTSPITDGTMTYAWTSDNAILGLETEGNGNISFVATNEGTETVTATFTVVPTYTNGETVCTGEGINFTVTVFPVVVMNAVENVVTCSDSDVDVTFATAITDGAMSYAWTNDNPAIGLEAEGNGNIAFTATNETGDVLVANITVTPTYANGENTCVGETVSFTVTVYPATQMNPVEDQTVYSREATEAITFTANVNDYEQKVIFNWTNDNPAIGLAESGTGNIPSFVTTGSGVEQVAHITVIPTYNGEEHSCEGEGYTFTITVLPTYLVVINEGIAHGTLTDDARVSESGEHYAPAGEVINLTVTPDAEYFLDYVTVTDLNNSSVVVPFESEYSFTMPEFDVLCNANFIDANNLSIQPGILDLGYRPINAWMYSKFFNVNNISESTFTVSEIELTNYNFMAVDPITLPFEIEAGNNALIGINTNYKNVAPGLYNATMALKGDQGRKAYLRDMVATAYTPVTPDVWELAANVTSFPYVSTQATEGTIYNNYQLPGETTDGYDGVYKVVIDHDVILNAAVTAGNDPKIAIYPEGFKGVGGPHTNNYLGSGDEILVSAVIGSETSTSTTSYMPYNTYYKNSICHLLFTAEELTAAGLTPGKINSIEFFSNSANGYTRDDLTVWMANTNLTEMSNSTMSVAGMTQVYHGGMTQVQGWNMFQFNGANFVWNGTSNILVTVLMHATSWNSQTYWVSATAPVAAAVYAQSDSNVYDANQTYPGNVTSNRPIIKINGVGGMTEGVAMGDEPITDLGLFPGTYYIVASSTSEDGYTVEINAEDMPLPEAPVAIYPAHESNGIETPVTFEYQLGQYTHEYQILLGTEYNSQEVVLDWTSDLSNTFDAGELLHNKIYFWRINERNSTGVTEGPLWIFTTELNVPLNLTVVDDELFEGENAVFNWDAPADRTLRGYNVYQDGVKLNEEVLTENTFTVEGLTYNMDGYDFNVTSVWDEGESEFSNTVSVAVSGFGTVSGHVYEQDGTTGIADATVTIVGFDEFDEIQSIEFTTNAEGFYSGQVWVGYFFGMAEKEGYQTIGDNTGIEIGYQATVTDYDFILNENYNAVSRVIAEEIDDNQVHVYWGWDLIEDFESGNLTSYEWVNDATYPWVITTTNPYEGSYCIKSSNEGVSSSTSAIEITMMIAKDGLMSFFAKASSESSYDKGQFFIDGVSKTSMSGNTGWVEKEYSITAGMHTFKWAYTKDSSFNSNDDCFYIDFINFWHEAEPVPEGQIFVNFESGMPNGWTSIDADGDGRNWGLITDYYSAGQGNEGSEDGAASQSYAGGALTPDNYLVSPQIDLGGTITFWAANYYDSFPEHFGIAVSTASNTNPSDFTVIWDATLSSKDQVPESREKATRVGSWRQYTVDLSAYAGQKGYVAFRHYNVTDMWALFIDDITIEQAANRAFTNFNVYRRNVSTGQAPQQIATGVTEMEHFDNTWGSAAAGVYEWGVSANYAGNRGESEITWSNKLDKNMTTNVTVHVATNSNDPATGAVVTLTNTSEPGLNLSYNVTLDETGNNTWDNFRKGTYDVAISLEGFEPLTATATIFEPTTLSYVLTEIIGNVEDLYVSTTGWAIFGEIPSVEPPAGAVTVILTTDDVWGDGSGYQMLLDADATAFGTIIPETGPLTTSGNASDATYAEFEYKIPENADGNLNTQNIVLNTSVAITIPAGVYDWCITNPTPGDRMWIASAGGSIGGRYNDFNFEAGKTYEFHVYFGGTNDATDLTVTDGKSIVANTYAPMANTEAKNIADVTPVNNGYVVLPATNRKVEYYNVKLDGIMEGTTTLPFFQHNVEGLIEGETYTTSVQKVYTTGESEWTDFSWVYTPCDNFEGLQGEPTAHWSGEDVVLNWTLPAGGNTPVDPVDPTGDNSFSFDFEGSLNGWNTIDADGNGLTWYHSSNSVTQSGYDYTGLGHNGSNGFAVSQSYIDGAGAYNADNYLYTPQMYDITNGSVLSFWADYGNDSYPDLFGVYVSTAANPTASDFTMVWQGTAKNSPAKVTSFEKAALRHGNSRYENWRQHNVDLSAYAGQTVWIAFRHVDYDNYEIWIDDVTLTPGGKGNRSSLVWDFEADFAAQEILEWTTINANNDEYTWYIRPTALESLGHNNSQGFVTSASYMGAPITPDDYLVSPQVTLGGVFSFWACAQDAGYPAEHFGVAVSTTGNTNAADFTIVDEWTLTAKGNGGYTNDTRSGNRVLGNWYQYTVDLSSYSGQGYIAIRHFNCNDMFRINVDDIEYTVDGDNPEPQPAANVIGVEIFRDGEWIAEVQAPATTYTDIAPANAEEYSIRVVYDGDPEQYLYYAMSCPQTCAVSEDPCKAPENLTGQYVWDAGEFGALITWTYGDYNAWLYYDDGNAASMVGAGGPFYWATMFPATMVAQYGDAALTQVAFIAYGGSDNQAGNFTFSIYIGGDNAPETLVHTQDYAFDGIFTGDWTYVTLTNPVAIDPTQNLWIVLYQDGSISYPAVFTNTGDTDVNARWLSEDGQLWEDVAQYIPSVKAWTIRGYVTNAVEPGETVALNPSYNANSNAQITAMPTSISSLKDFNFSRGSKSPVSFNVYRNGTLIDNVNYTEDGLYTYFDDVNIGTYEYQVTAVYDECESGFAMTPDHSMDYVEVSVTGVDDLSLNTALYPNPTHDKVRIEAADMNHITVVNTLGQVLYDANVSGDNCELSLGQYEAGLYLVRIVTANGTCVKRVVVTK